MPAFYFFHFFGSLIGQFIEMSHFASKSQKAKVDVVLKDSSVVFSCWLASADLWRGAETSVFSLSVWGSIGVVLRLFCFSEVAIKLARVVTGASRNALRGECLHLQLQRENTAARHFPQFKSICSADVDFYIKAKNGKKKNNNNLMTMNDHH